MSITNEKKKELLAKYPSIKNFELEDVTIVLYSDQGYANPEAGALADELLVLYGLDEEMYGLTIRTTEEG